MAKTVKNFARVAMIQMKVVADDAEANLTRAEQLLAAACAEGPVDFAVVPECFDIGWGNPRAAQLATPVPGPVSDRLCVMAQRFNIYLASGITEKDGEATYNSALLISPEGEILLKHRKINVCYDVTDVYDIGDRLGVAETPFGRIGLDICADNFVNNTALAHSLGRMGARMILSPSSWAVGPGHDNEKTPYGSDWSVPYEQLSRLYDMAIVGVSNVGPVTMGSRTGWSSIGNSMAYAPGGFPLAVLPFGEDAETVFTVEVPLMASPARGDLTAAELEKRGYTGI